MIHWLFTHYQASASSVVSSSIASRCRLASSIMLFSQANLIGLSRQTFKRRMFYEGDRAIVGINLYACRSDAHTGHQIVAPELYGPKSPEKKKQPQPPPQPAKPKAPSASKAPESSVETTSKVEPAPPVAEQQAQTLPLAPKKQPPQQLAKTVALQKAMMEHAATRAKKSKKKKAGKTKTPAGKGTAAQGKL